MERSPFETNYNEEGVDLDQLELMLSMTPTERADYHFRFMSQVMRIWEQNGIKPLTDEELEELEREECPNQDSGIAKEN